MDSKELLQQQLEEIKSKKENGKPIEIAKAAGIRYNSELQAIVELVKKDIRELLVPQIKYLEPDYTADSWFDTIESIINRIREKYSNPYFQRLASRIASNFVSAVDAHVNNQFKRSYKSFGINAFNTTGAVSDYLEISAADNVKLIESIPSQYLDQVRTMVTTNMRAGLRSTEITKQLSDRFNITKNRAKFIARDQSSKISNGIARKRMQASGFQYFQWIDSDDSRVRTRHRKIADTVTKYGKGIYRWDELPLSDDGKPIATGDDYACRCISRPVSDAEVERNKKQGKTNPNWTLK